MADVENKNTISHEELMTDVQGFETLARLLFDHTGIYMDSSEKNYSLMANRMLRILKKYSCNTYKDFINVLLTQKNHEATEEFYQVLTTNTTNFFRENEHFVFLKKQIPLFEKIMEQEKRTELRVWCAASSTGEEPYTILMSILDTLSFISKTTLKMMATDINTIVLEKAKQGIYKKEALQNASREQLSKYFESKEEIGQDYLQVKEMYRNMIEFKKFNLNEMSYLFLNKFDFIFCRNVLIYFTPKAVQETVSKLSRCLHKDGLLFIGHSESLVGDNPYLKSVIPAVYQLKS